MSTLRISGARAMAPPTATLQLTGASMTGTVPSPVKLRVAGAGAYGTPVPGGRLRVAGVKVSGTAAAVPHLRVAGARVSGSAAISLRTIADRTVEPFTTVTTTAEILSGGPAQTYTWRQIEGPIVALTGLGATRSFESLGMVDRHVVVLGVTATDTSGNKSAEVRVTVNVRDHTMFLSDGSSWVPMPALWSNGTAWVQSPY